MASSSRKGHCWQHQLPFLYLVCQWLGPKSQLFPRTTFFSRGSELTHLLAWLLIAFPEPGRRGRACQFTGDLGSRTSEEAGLETRWELIGSLSHKPSPASSGGFLLSIRGTWTLVLSSPLMLPVCTGRNSHVGTCLCRGMGQVCWAGAGTLQPRDGAVLPQSDGFQKATPGRRAPGDSFWLSFRLRFDKVPMWEGSLACRAWAWLEPCCALREGELGQVG